MFLLNRFLTQGTLSDPHGIPDPAFSLPGTLNWMRALAVLVDRSAITPASARQACLSASVAKANLSPQAENTVFEQALMSLHHLASLKAMCSLDRRIDPARSAIVTWYYGIYHAASAMIAAQCGGHQDNHAETANSWDRQFMGRPYIPEPFGYRVSTLVKKDMETEIEAMRAGNPHDLNTAPTTGPQAFGACMSYLKGSAAWRRAYIEDELKERELKKEGLDSFRSKRAQQIRDARLTGKAFGFVHQAFRYRGKANYREALFISYGPHVETALATFNDDLFCVLKGFLTVSGAFCSARLGKDLWNAFHDDLTANADLLAKPADVWLRG